MPTIGWKTHVALLSLIAGAPTLAAAQGEPTPRPGEQVQVRVVGPATAPVGVRCAGSVAALAGDTVVLGQPRTCPAGSYDADLRIARGHHGSRLAHTALGLVGGAVAGGIIGRLSAGDGCVVEGCDDGDLVVAIKTVIGTAAGGVIGAVVGAFLPTGPRWLTETATRPVRVGRLELHPELRVSFDLPRGH